MFIKLINYASKVNFFMMSFLSYMSPDSLSGDLGRKDGDNKILCVANEDSWLPLEIAIKIAKARILLKQEIGKKVDSKAIKTRIDTVINLVKEFSAIQLGLTNIVKMIESSKSEVKKLKDAIILDLGDIQKMLD